MEVSAGEIVTVVLAVAGGISALGGAYAVIKRWIADSKSAKNAETLKEHGEQLRDLTERVQVLEQSHKTQDKAIGAMCATLLAMLEHEITGNSIDKLKAARDELHEYLIHRGEG